MNRHNIHPKDLRFEIIDVGGNWRSRPFGARVTHIPSGKCFESVESRSHHLNRNHCLNQLEAFLDTWDPMKKKYIIKAIDYREAVEIAKSHGLGPTDIVHVGIATDCDHITGLPKGYRPDTTICTISGRATDNYNLRIAHWEWDCYLFEQLTEAQKQKFLDHVTNTLDGFLWCDRVWDAWYVGTMSQDDFSPAGTDEVIYEHAVSMYIMFLEMKREAII